MNNMLKWFEKIIISALILMRIVVNRAIAFFFVKRSRMRGVSPLQGVSPLRGVSLAEEEAGRGAALCRCI